MAGRLQRGLGVHAAPRVRSASSIHVVGVLVYDLLIVGGRVVDPSQGLDRRSDIAVRDGRIVTVEPKIDRDLAGRIVDASGQLVTPGLIDLHVHVYPGVSHYGIDPDTYVLPSGVTTALDAGSAGASTFEGLRRYVIDVSNTRLFALPNISGMGMVSQDVGELLDIRWADPKAAIRMCEKHRDIILGVKLRMTRELAGDNGLQALANAREAADAVGLPVMVHPQDAHCALDDILNELRDGDIVTHCFHGMRGGILDRDGRVLDSVRHAIDRGVRLDLGHGQGSFDFRVAEQALAQEVIPHTISSDLHAHNVDGPVFDLASTISKFMLLGLDLSDAIHRCTSVPAEFLGMAGRIGTLVAGAHADVAIFDEENGTHRFEDAHGQARIGEHRLVPRIVIKGGEEIAGIARSHVHQH